MGTSEVSPGTDDRRVRRAILFADVADSTRLFREHGDVRARELLSAALDLGRASVDRVGGRVVETIGDELFCVLPDGDAALHAAIGLHEAVLGARLQRELPASLAFRVGLAQGLVGLDGDHVFGDTVYLAKRVSTSAKAEQVLTTGETRDSLELPAGVSSRLVDVIRLKGRVDEIELVEIVWRPDATIDLLDTPQPGPDSAPRSLHVSHGERFTVVGLAQPSVSIGRNQTCDLWIDDIRVSRLHALIELRRDGFALVDMSRNGCSVRSDAEPPCTALRCEVSLGDAGEIQLGPDVDAPVLRFVTRDPGSD